MGYRSPYVYTLAIKLGSTAPADSLTYYGGVHLIAWSDLNRNLVRLYIPKTGRIVGVQLHLKCAAAGTAENVIFALRLNDTTDYPIATISMNSTSNLVQNLNLNISVVSGDYVELKMTTPAWVTNPTTCYTGGHILIECE